MNRCLSIAALCLASATGPLLAAEQDILTGAEVSDVLFGLAGRSVEVAEVDWLGRDERRALQAYGAEFPYFGAMAVSPGDRADSGSAVSVANYHAPQAAEAAALADCEARRVEGAPCVILATIAPEGFEMRGLTLSVTATAALVEGYSELAAPKAFAISPSTDVFAFAEGDGTEALDQCAASAPEARDCRIVVADK